MKKLIAFVIAIILLTIFGHHAMAQDSTFFDIGSWDQSAIWIQDDQLVIYKKLNHTIAAVAFSVLYKGDYEHQFGYQHVKQGSRCYFRGVKVRLFREIPCAIFNSMDRMYSEAVDSYIKNMSKPLDQG